MKRRISEKYARETASKKGEPWPPPCKAPPVEPGGILLKVHLKNFMCHDNLEIDLKPNVNFIIGRNGGGKSTILIAIIFALSGRASSTARGRPLAEFIQSGKSQAKIIVHLQNKGRQPYHPESYGSVIIIVRTLNRSGRHTFAIKDENGKVQSTKPEVIHEITKHFGILVDNPLIILNQDLCKYFLVRKTKNEKYNFFNSATMLDVITENIKTAQSFAALCEHKLEKKKERKEALEQKVLSLEKDIEESKQSRLLVRKLAELEQKLTWAILLESQMQVEQLAQKCSELQNKREQMLQKLATFQDGVRVEKEAQLQLSQQLSHLSTCYAQETRKIQAANTSLTAIKKKLRTFKTGVYQEQELEVERHARELGCIKEQIDKEKESSLRSLEELTEQLAQKKESLLQLQAEREESQTQHDQLKDVLQTAMEDLTRIKYEEASVVERLEDCERELSSLVASTPENVYLFGDYTEDLFNKIDLAYEQGTFSKKPIGPVANYVSLRDERWSKAVEMCLNKMLTAYCVATLEDHRELIKLMKELLPESGIPSIVTITFTSSYYCGLPRPVDCFHPTVYEVLSISHPVISNSLVEHLYIESVLLLEDGKEAWEMMNNNPPKPCNMAFTKSGDIIFPSPKFRYYSSTFKAGGFFLKESHENNIKAQRELLEPLQEEYDEVKKRLSDKEEEIGMHEEEEAERRKESIALSCAVTVAEGEVQALEEEISRLQNRAPNYMILLENKRDEEMEKYKEAKNSMALLEATNRKHMEDIDKLKLEASTAMEHSEQLLEEIERIKAQKRATETNLAALNMKIRKYEAQIKAGDKEIIAAEETRQQMFKEIEDQRDQLPLHIPRLDPPEVIQEEIQTIKMQIHINQMKKMRDVHELEQERQFTKQAAEQEAVSYERLHRHYQIFYLSLEQRIRDFHRIREACTLEADSFFGFLLMKNKFRGKLVFNHQARTLDIKVNALKQDSTLPSLSGGERAFATTAFFLAVWRLIDAPFRIIDEYDICMDHHNMKISAQMLVQEAERFPSNQYIFLTPHELQNVKANIPCHVFKMPEPRPETKATST